MIHVPTGAGKTYASYFGPLAQLIDKLPTGLTLLYVTPLRAVARDVEKSLRRPIDDLSLDLRLEVRNGDTPAHIRLRQKKKIPQILITTPESLSLLLSYPDAKEKFAGLRAVIVDEWHELIGNKRGTQVELALARLRRWNPNLQTWALSAKIQNLEEAAQVVVGPANPYTLISIKLARKVDMDVLLPEKVNSFPWAGHLGLTQNFNGLLRW